jgi:hypothetical protein
MDDQNTRDHSPNVGDIRWLGAKSVMLLCQTCQHRQVANIEQLPDDTSLALIASKFVCPQCQQGGARPLQSSHFPGVNSWVNKLLSSQVIEKA